MTVLVSWRAHWTALLQIFLNPAVIKCDTGAYFTLCSIGGASQRIQRRAQPSILNWRSPGSRCSARKPRSRRIPRCKVLIYRNDARLASERTELAPIWHVDDDTDLSPIIERRPQAGRTW
jgi:hypothetical protein